MEEIETEAKVHTIVFDFASVTYLDSTGVKYLKVKKKERKMNERRKTKKRTKKKIKDKIKEDKRR